MTTMQDQGDVPELSLGLRLEIARRRADMSQGAMADELGFDRSTISDFERDVRPPKRGTMIAWARLTNISLTWLETGQAANPEGGGLRVVRHQGLEPRTRCLSASNVTQNTADDYELAA